MDGMAHAPGPSHARKPATSRPHDRIAAWLVLAFAGTTMVSFNMWHAIHGGIVWPLAVLYGLAPVIVALGLSHMVAAYRGGWFMKGVTFAIMLGAMALSIRATGYVVKPASGNLWPLFGIVTDSAALLALQVVMSPESRAAAKAARKAAEEATAGAAEEAMPSAVSVPLEVPSAEPRIVPAAEPAPVPSPRPSQSQRPKVVRLSKEPDAEEARAVYRKSVRQGSPLSDRALGEMFGHSRTWGASRIRETEAGPHLAAKTGS
jgi:hypothetical protein